jgi:hypothetical protein
MIGSPFDSVISHKDVTNIVITMVSVFRCQVSGFNDLGIQELE